MTESRKIDAHAHLGDFPGFVSGGDHTAAMLVDEYDRAGIASGLISVLEPDNPRSGNERVEAACRAFPGRLFGFAYVNPHDVEGAVAELDRCARIECFQGVKLHPANDAYYPFHERYFPVYERIEQLGKPTLWHSGTTPFSHPLQIADVARRFPGSTHILGHFGIAELSWECFPAADLAGNIVVDTSINPVIGLMNDFIDRFGADRMLWGSDYPWYHVEYELLKVQFLGRTEDDRRRIGGVNAGQLFGV
jgi:predicted TIM-barrel fold metal-dependent hydrolase